MIIKQSTNAGKYDAEIITGAKINIENGFKIPPLKIIKHLIVKYQIIKIKMLYCLK